jgi:hypothetical protein
MGNQPSLHTQLTRVFNRVSNAQIAKASTSAAGAINNTQDLAFSGTNRNIRVEQSATIDISVLANQSVNSKLQSDVATSIIAELTKKDTDFPQIARGMSRSDLQSIVENNVSTSLDARSIATLTLSSGQLQRIRFDGDNRDIQVSQTAESMGQLVNNMNSKMASELISRSDVQATTSATTTNFAADVIGAVGAAVGNVIKSVGDIFGLSPFTVVMIMVFIVIAGYIIKSHLDRQPPGTPLSVAFGFGPKMKRVPIKKPEPPPAPVTGASVADPIESYFGGGVENYLTSDDALLIPGFEATDI